MIYKSDAGKFERHLLRKQGNLLFPVQEQHVLPAAIEQARHQDQIALQNFIEDFQALVKKAVDLEPNAPSEKVLELKEELDRCFQVSYTLPGDVDEIRKAIQTLVKSIMQAVWKGIGNDEYARQKLQDEEIARDMHFKLQQNPLIADLTDPDSQVQESELIPSLLSETTESLQQVMQIFDAQQTTAIFYEAKTFLDATDPNKEVTLAWDCFAVLKEIFLATESTNIRTQ